MADCYKIRRNYENSKHSLFSRKKQLTKKEKMQSICAVIRPKINAFVLSNEKEKKEKKKSMLMTIYMQRKS
jgi:hypothetical protein